MKAPKKMKQPPSAAMTPKTPCGTLSYLAECRGAPRKSGTFLKQGAAVDFTNRIVRRFPAER